MSDYEEKYARAIAELNNSKIPKVLCQPGADRLFKYLGFKPRPPHYRSFLRNLIGVLLFFVPYYLFLMILKQVPLPTLESLGLFWLSIYILTIVVGPLWYALSARWSGLSKWKSL